MVLGRLRISSPHRRYHLFHCLVRGPGAYRTIPCSNVACRKPLGEPNPQAVNLALALVLLLVLLLQGTFNVWQDFSTNRVMSSIKEMLPAAVTVRRDGTTTQVPARDLVPGDIITISMGDKIPADARLVEVSSDLTFDRSVLTGEVRN